MKKLKRILAGAFATVAMLALAGFASCAKEQPAGDSSSSESEAPEIIDPSCTDKEKGHAFDEKTGLCIRCEKDLITVSPALAENQTFPTVTPCTHIGGCGCEFKGKGTQNDRVEIVEGCYTLTVGDRGETWYSFSVKSAGQYVFHSVDGTNDVEVARYSAMPGLPLLNPEGVDALNVDEDFYSYVNCSTAEFGEDGKHWRATYCLTGKAGAQVKVRLVRFADPAWMAKNIVTKVSAEQLTEKAEDVTEDGKVLTEVSYDERYYFDRTDGYYHTASGEIIYAAIDCEAPRLFGESESGQTKKKFTTILRGNHGALDIQTGTADNGDILIDRYIPFMMNWTNDDATWSDRGDETPAANPNKVCYQNYCNSDGVYPVNQELYDFLNLYAQSRGIADDNAYDSEGELTVDKSKLWLAACFYYKLEIPGTLRNPISLTVGENSVDVSSASNLFCIIKEAGTYLLSCEDEGVAIKIGNATSVSAPFEKLEVASRTSFFVYKETAGECQMTITVTKVVEAELTIPTEEVGGVIPTTNDIPLSISAGNLAILTNTYAAGAYTITWTGNPSSVLVNGEEYTQGALIVPTVGMTMRITNDGNETLSTVVTITREEVDTEIELFVGDIPLTISAEKFALAIGSLDAGNYTLNWTDGVDITVLVNGAVYTEGAVLVFTDEYTDVVVQIINNAATDVDLTLTLASAL